MSMAIKNAAKTLQFDDFTHVPPNTGLETLARFHEQGPHTPLDIQPPVLEQEKGYEDGFDEGRSAAHSENERRTNIAEELAGNFVKITNAIEESHGRVIATVLQAVLPALAKKSAGAEIKEFILSLSAQALSGQVILNTHPDNKNILDKIIHDCVEAAQGLPGFTVETDINLSGQKVSAHWQGGGGNIDIEGAVEHVLNLIKTE